MRRPDRSDFLRGAEVNRLPLVPEITKLTNFLFMLDFMCLTYWTIGTNNATYHFGRRFLVDHTVAMAAVDSGPQTCAGVFRSNVESVCKKD